MNDRASSAELFSEMYEKYSKYVFNFFKKDFGTEDAEDLTQQTFLQLWAWLPACNEIRSKRVLIFRIARNVRLDKFRKNATRLETVFLPELCEITDNEDKTKIIDIKLSINRLSAKEQQLLYMKLSGLSSAQIGEKYGISASSVRTRLQKIRSKLK